MNDFRNNEQQAQYLIDKITAAFDMYTFDDIVKKNIITPRQYDFLVNYLVDKVDKALTKKYSFEEIQEDILSVEEYDFLIECGIDFDDFTLFGEGKEVVKKICRDKRKKFPDGYNKIYPEEKQEVFNKIVDFIKTIADNSECNPLKKNNYRDMDFYVNRTHYHIVISQPREKKKQGE